MLIAAAKKAAVDQGCEAPSFISRTVAHRRVDRQHS
jgi:hypothetical protein